MVKRWISLTLFMAAAFFLTGCPWPPHRIPSPIFSSYVGNGFQMVPAPTKYYSPGKILRVRKDVPYEVTDLAAEEKLPVSTYPEMIGHIIGGDRHDFNLGFIFGPVADAGVNYTDSYSLEFNATGVNRGVIDDMKADPLIEKVLKKVKWRKDFRYYIIREAVSAERLQFTFDSDALARIGGEGKFNKLVSAHANLSGNSTTGYRVNSTFTEPLYIFYKVEELTPAPIVRSILPGGKSFKRTLVTDELKWEEGR